jgi:AAA domain
MATRSRRNKAGSQEPGKVRTLESGGLAIGPGTLTGHTITAADLMALELAPERWAVPGIVPEGVTLLAGKPKMGKSWMALGLCVAIATGGVALGNQRVDRGECLYLALEDNPRRLQKRLRKLKVSDADLSSLHIATSWPRLGDGGAEKLERWLEGLSNTRLVVVDTLARFKKQPSGRRSNAYDEDRAAVDPLVSVAADHGVAILLVHHLREMESDDPLDMITGSVGLTGGVDGALVLKRDRGKPDAYLHVDGRDIENPVELALKWDASAATWAIVGDAEHYRLSERRRVVLEVLEKANAQLGPKEIAEMIDAKEGAVRQMLSQMVKDGQVKNLGHGRYVHPNFQEMP